MLNDYEIRGDVAVIFLRRYKGKPNLEAIIDSTDLPIAQSISGRWLAESKKDGRVYVKCDLRRSDHGGKSQVYLHRLITGAPAGLVVDHINHDTLYNRQRNLRVVNQHVNGFNRKGPLRRNDSGFRGVSWKKSHKKWVARLRFNGKDYSLGLHDDKYDAHAAVQKKIKELNAENASSSAG